MKMSIKNLLMPVFLMGCFSSGFSPWQKTAPLKRPTKRSMKITKMAFWGNHRYCRGCIFLLTVGSFLAFFSYSWSLFTHNFGFLLTIGAFFAYNGKVPLKSTLRDCKQSSLTVSKKAPTVSKKASPVVIFRSFLCGLI